MSVPTIKLGDKSLVTRRIKNPPAVKTVDEILITPDIASAMLATTKKNRGIMPGKVKQYVEAANRGKWIDTGDTIRFDTAGNLIDGQHKLTMIVKTGLSFSYTVTWGLPCNAQGFIDTGSKRSLSQHLGLNGVDHPNASGGAVRLIVAIENGSSVSTWPELTYEEYYDFIQDNLDMFSAAVRFGLSIWRTHKCPASPIAAAYFQCAWADEAVADQFFGDLRDMVGLDPASVIVPLSKALATYNERTKGSVARPTQVILYNMLVDTFNKHREGKVVKSVRVPQKATHWIMPG